jgi:hypothetical protein
MRMKLLDFVIFKSEQFCSVFGKEIELLYKVCSTRAGERPRRSLFIGSG